MRPPRRAPPSAPRPGPDLAALALKIALAVDDQAWELTGAAPCLAALKADARRLADKIPQSAELR